MPYRPEIDGLRAVAVLSVLLFHLDINLVPGGFVGVDVFFVISGFLITTILMQDLAAGRFSLARFYRRRTLRILPPLILVLVVTLAVAPAVLLPGELHQTAQAAIAALFFASNIFFWSSFDYFTPDAKENPFLHTWSLGIEEQFYLIVPLILWALHRRGRGLLVPVFALSVAVSFALAVWAVADRPKATFYLLPTRYWELGAGALLAMVAPHLRLRRGLAEALGAAGLALVAAGLVLVTPASTFPGVNALWPVLGATALIAAGGATLAGRALSLAPVVFVGTISYALYLWHWPLIVLWKLRTGPDLSAPEQAGLGLAAVILATLSTRFLEARFRHLPARIPDGRVLAVSGGALVLTAGLAALMPVAATHLRDYPAAVTALDRYDDFHTSPAFIAQNRRYRCFLTGDTPGGFDSFDRSACLEAEVGRPRLLILGDSLAAHLWQAIQTAHPDHAVLQANASGCRPFAAARGDRYCTDLNRFIHEDWLPAHAVDAVVLSARWQHGEAATLRATVERLRALGIPRVIVLGPTVEYETALPKLLARDLLAGTARAPHATDADRRAVSAELVAALAGTGATYVDMIALLCPDGPCRTWAPGLADAPPVPMSFDYGHYTPEGAAHVAGLLAPVLRPAFNSPAVP